MGPRFEDIYARHADAVFRFALRLVGRRDVAEDITSETFLELVQQGDRIETDRLPGWLYTVARNRAMDYWRRRTLENRFAAGYEEPIQPEPTYEPNLFDHTSLRPVHRVCLVLRYVHGMTQAEIAQHTGLSEMQIKGYLQYARQLLRAAFTKAPS
jgi:RNA polymerase sigma-70 factor, ECF subfamily